MYPAGQQQRFERWRVVRRTCLRCPPTNPKKAGRSVVRLYLPDMVPVPHILPMYVRTRYRSVQSTGVYIYVYMYVYIYTCVRMGMELGVYVYVPLPVCMYQEHRCMKVRRGGEMQTREE